MTLDATTEVWVRNPKNVIRECLDVGHLRFVWDMGAIMKKRYGSIERWVEMYLPPGSNWEILVVDEMIRYAVGQSKVYLYTSEGGATERETFPLWRYGEPWELLEEMVKRQAKQDNGLVMISQLPNPKLDLAKEFYSNLNDLQEEHENVRIHLHGSYSYPLMFGNSFGSVDVDIRTRAAKGFIELPCGGRRHFEDLDGVDMWVNLLGYKPEQLSEPRNRCMYNLRSAIWAGQNFKKETTFPNPQRPRGKASAKYLSKLASGEDDDSEDHTSSSSRKSA